MAADKNGSTALQAKNDPGNGILVDARGGRPIGDTSTSAVYCEELPTNFHGGDEALHFSLGKLFGEFGKIKKIELYMDKGQMDVDEFTGNALVVYHPTKLTGKREPGDPVWEACSKLDGKFHLLGWKHWRMKCEAATWQKEGYSVKDKEKLIPCVELENLWVYDPNQPIGYYMGLQGVIRDHAAENAKSPFCKIDPMTGGATVWFGGAKEAMAFAGKMHKSFFMGRKIVASLTRKARPKTDDWDGIKDLKKTNSAVDDAIEKARAAGTFTLFPDLEKMKRAAPAPPNPEDIKNAELNAALAEEFADDIDAVKDEMAAAQAEADAEDAESAAKKPKTQPFRFKQGTRVQLVNLEARPENNGKKGDILKWLPELQKYQVQLDFGSKVKVKRENLEMLDELSTNDAMFTCEHKAAQREDKEAEALAAHLAAKAMADKMLQKPKALTDATAADFEATVCVDAALLKKTAEAEKKLAEEEELKAEQRRRDRSRSRDRLQKEALEAAKARLAAAGPRSGWVVSAPDDMAAGGAGGTAAPAAPVKEPPESREELMKLSVGKLKALLVEYGKSARGCLEKGDFVDRLKPKPKAE